MRMMLQMAKKYIAIFNDTSKKNYQVQQSRKGEGPGRGPGRAANETAAAGPPMNDVVD